MSFKEVLAARPSLDEANFWRPSGKRVVGYLSIGDPFVFKLKKGHGHAVVGFGLFVAFARLSVAEAWETFVEKNGAPSLEAMWRRVSRYAYRSGSEPYRPSHPIGCDLLAGPVFFPEDLWVPGPADWSDNTVTGKGYDVTRGEGRRIWQACLEHAAACASPSPGPLHLGEEVADRGVTELLVASLDEGRAKTSFYLLLLGTGRRGRIGRKSDKFIRLGVEGPSEPGEVLEDLEEEPEREVIVPVECF